MTKPKILFYDIETSPNIVTTFNIKDKNPIHHQNIQQERYIICASYKWAGHNQVHSTSVTTKNPQCDVGILFELAGVIEEADAVVAHFGDGFDLPFINSRLAFHDLNPLAPVVQIDTCKMAKQKFLFNSNKLDYLAQYFGFGKKDSIGYSTWIGCMKGDSMSLAKMIKYNKHDVVLLEKVYERLAAYCKPRINHTLFSGACTHCGGSHLQKRGFNISKTKRTQRFQCVTCGGWQ